MCILPRFNFSVEQSPLFFGDVQKNWATFENYSSELIKVMDDDDIAPVAMLKQFMIY